MKRNLYIICGFFGSGKTSLLSFLQCDNAAFFTDYIDLQKIRQKNIFSYGFTLNNIENLLQNCIFENIFLESVFLSRKLQNLQINFNVRVIFCLDLLNYDFLLDKMPEYLEMNLKYADFVVLNKTKFINEKKFLLIKKLHLSEIEHAEELKLQKDFYTKIKPSIKDYKSVLEINLERFFTATQIKSVDAEFYRLKGFLKSGELFDSSPGFKEHSFKNKNSEDVIFYLKKSDIDYFRKNI